MRIYRCAVWLATSIILALTGCQAPPRQGPSVDPSQMLDFETAVGEMSNSLIRQINEPSPGIFGQLRDQLAESVSKRPRKPAVLDRVIDTSSGLHTALAARLEQGLLTRLNVPASGISVAALTATSLAQTDLLISGTIALDRPVGSMASSTGAPARAWMVVISRRSGKVIAKATALIRNDGFALTPNRLEQDSPVVLLDEAVGSQIASVMLQVGQSADARYLAQLGASALIDAGTTAYATQQFDVASERFGAALADPSGVQLRALTGSYLASVKLGRLDRAEEFFSQMVAYGIREKKLGVKFLFRPGSTEFWQSNQVSGLYRMWIRQAARGVGNAGTCVELVGHASKTGTESFNDRLSEQRALLIRERMVQEQPTLVSRIYARGAGFREPIVGTGTDDAGDAEDRRVAFAFHDCLAK